MRKVALLCILALPFAVQPAFGQGPPGFPLQLPQPGTTYKGITKDDLKEFCIFNDSVFSIGTTICSAKGTASSCEKTGDRAQWKTSKAEQCGDPLVH